MSEKEQGEKKYTPTRIEWLSVFLNSIASSSLIEAGIGIYFLPVQDENTLGIFIRHKPDVDKERLDNVIEASKQLVDHLVKDYKWDSWINIVEFINVEDEKRD